MKRESFQFLAFSKVLPVVVAQFKHQTGFPWGVVSAVSADGGHTAALGTAPATPTRPIGGAVSECARVDRAHLDTAAGHSGCHPERSEGPRKFARFMCVGCEVLRFAQNDNTLDSGGGIRCARCDV